MSQEGGNFAGYLFLVLLDSIGLTTSRSCAFRSYPFNLLLVIVQLSHAFVFSYFDLVKFCFAV